MGEHHGGGVGKAVLVGRELQLAQLAGEVTQRTGLVLIEGEAGIGKTRLVREGLSAPALSGLVVATAACPPLPEPFAWGPMVEAVRQCRSDLTGLNLSPLAGALASLFPEWATELPTAEPVYDTRAMRHRICRALCELITAIGVDVLLVEDAHWADSATLEFLLMLCVAAPHTRDITVVVTYRPDDVPAGSLLPRLTSCRPQVRMKLAPLNVELTRQMVASMVGTDVSLEFSTFLHRRTAGLPLAVEECVLLLTNRRDVVRGTGALTRRTVDELDVPPTVRDLVLERANRLDPQVRRVLSAAAVLAVPASEDVLQAVAGVNVQAVADALDCGLLHGTSPGRFAFRHVLAEEAIREAISASERTQLHLRAATTLRDQAPAPVARLSRHYREAGKVDQWARYAEAASDAALRSGDTHSAVRTLHDLLSSMDHPPDRRIRLARRLGEAAVHRAIPLGELELAVCDTLRGIIAAEDLDDEDRGELRLLLGWLCYQLGKFDAGTLELETAVDALGRRPESAARTMLLLAAPESPRDWPASRHLAWLTRVSELIPHVENASVRQQLLIDRATILLALGEETGWDAVDEFPVSAASPVDEHHIVRGRHNAGQHALDWGRLDDAREHLTAVAVLASAAGYQRGTEYANLDRALLDWYLGEWDGLIERVKSVIKSEESPPLLVLEANGLLGALQLAMGQRDSAELRLRAVVGELVPTRVMDLRAGLPVAALGQLLLTESAHGEVLRITAPVMEAITAKGIWLRAQDVAPVHVAALVADGRLCEAEELLRRFRAGSAPASLAAEASCQALVTEARGATSRAAEAFAHAAELWAALPRPLDELRMLERRAHCLLATGGSVQGLELLRQIEHRLNQFGARWDADRVAHALRHHGVHVARTWRRGRHGYGDELSPRELEIVRLVSLGNSNRQVAQTLFLSPKTVGHHLSRAMRKLGVSSRTALVRTAAADGLLADKD
ncbi:ATP-binding protein [Streptomyces sp. NPDC002920]